MPGLSGLEWSVDYTQRLNRCIKLYEDQGYTVSNGGPNGYVLSVGGAALSGRPDVIATKGGDCIVIDFPEGEPTRSHALQVMIHMYALSHGCGSGSEAWRLVDSWPMGENRWTFWPLR